MCKKLIYLTFFFAFCPMAMASDIAISTQGGWMGQGHADTESQEIVDNVTDLFVEVFAQNEQDALADWVADRTGDGVSDLLIMFGIFPSSIYPAGNAQPDGSIAENFLDDGNVIINTGDYIFYVGSAGNNDAGGLANMMDVPGAAMWGDDTFATMFIPTADGQLYTPSLTTLPSNRPWFPGQFAGTDWEVELILAQTSDGSQVHPAILHNTVTDGRLGVFFQCSLNTDTQPRGEVISEWINNWYIPNVASDEPIVKARRPDPADGAEGVTGPLLQWKAHPMAKFHDVYLGTDQIAVINATSSDPMGPAEVYKVRYNYAMWWELTPWIPGATYYWRIDEVEVDGTTHRGDLWSFTAAPLEAYDPDPRDGAKWIDPNPTLYWSPGADAVMHDVYLGTDETEVANGTGGTFKGNQADAFYATGTLVEGTTYYWRIDGTDLPGTTKYPGHVWSFTTMPHIPITDPDLLGRWTLDEGEGSTAIDWSGHGNHGVLMNGPQWVLDGYYGGALEFDGQNDFVSVPLDVSETEYAAALWFRTTNGDCGLMAVVDSDRGPSHDRHIYLTGGNIRIRLWDTEEIWTTGLSLANGRWHHVAYMVGATIGGQQIYVDGILRASGTKNASDFDWQQRINIGFSHDAAQDHFQGVLDDVRVYDKTLTQEEIKQVMRGDPLLAWNPKPTNASIPDIEHATPLSWSPGDNAAKHDVYLGTDRDALEDADTTTTGVYRGRIDPNSYTPAEGVELGQTYYWRIDEFNTDATISEGRIWSFTVADHLIVDDFEAYDDYCNRIFYTYVDGWGHNGDAACGVPPYAGNGTGSTVGYLSEPYAEQTITHDGSFQSMPFEYLNDGSDGRALYSETERTFEFPQDFTRKGMKSLTLWFQGRPGSPNSSSYDAVTDTHTLAARTGDIWGSSDQCRYVYKRLSGAGSIQTKILDVTLGAAGWTKVGVMIREDLEPNSPHAFSMLTPPGRTALQHRVQRGQRSYSAHSDEGKITYPYWVKIERTGNSFTAYYSSNGTTWIPQPNDENLDPDTTASNPANIPMNVDTYIGLALTSNNVNATVQAQFSNVTTTGAVTGQWQAADIGVTANDAEQLYVALEDSAGQVKDVPHPNPNAVQLNTWQEWNIDLADFAPVDVTRVKKIYIGVGNRNLPTLGGGGMLYIDDIRLYAPRCAPLMLKPDADIAEPYDCKVDYKDLSVLAHEWLCETQLQDWQYRAAYWDARYVGAWGGNGVAMRDGLAAAGYTILDADQLKTWMDARIADKQSSVVVFCLDIVPETVGETMDTDCTARKYLDAGGKIVWYADWPFYYVGHPDGTTTTWGGAGASAILGFDASSGPNDSLDVVVFTSAGATWGLTTTWQSQRPTSPTITSNLTPLATISSGSAAAWAKHFVTGDRARGFVRIWDTTGTPPVADVISVAESKGFLAADLYDDEVVDFKDYAVLADSWLEEVVWP